jgi:hypothetical protein
VVDELARRRDRAPIPEVRSLSRESFLRKFSQQWSSDQHISLIGPTGRGKTYTARQILQRRPGRILILAPKGVDKTLAGFGHKIVRWPPPFLTPRPNDRGDWVLRLEPPLVTMEERIKMRGHFGRAMQDAFAKGQWTIYCDELQVTADPRMMGLGKMIESILLMGRSRDVSMVSSIQVPRWAPRAAYDQASHVLLWRQRDAPAQKRIGEISGVDTRAVIDAVASLDFHEFLWVDATRDMLFRVNP